MKSLKTKLAVAVGVLVTCACVVLGTTTFIMNVFSVGSTVKRDISKLAEQVSETTKYAIDSKLTTLSEIAENPVIKDTDAALEKKAEEMTEAVKRIGCFHMSYIDASGNVYSNEGTTYSASDREYFTRAMSGERCISDPIIVKADQSVVVIYAVPIKNGNKVTGVLTANYDGAELSKIINNSPFGKTGTGFMVNKSGTIVADADISMVEELVNPLEAAKKDEAYKSLSTIVEKMVGGQVGMQNYDAVDGKKKTAGYAPVEGNDLYVCLSVEKEEVYEFLNTQFRSILWIIVIALAVCVLVGYRIASVIGRKVNQCSVHLEHVANGNLTVKLDEKQLSYKDEIGGMARSLDAMQNNLQGIVGTIQENSFELGNKSEELSENSEEISKLSKTINNAITDIAEGTSHQAGELMEINDLLGQFNEKLEIMDEQINIVDDSSTNIDQMAAASSGEMNELNASMNQVSRKFDEFQRSINKLGDSIQEVNHITSLIADVANQTNLLALNASIEAARAGEAGRGFAVVAEEISNLADQSKTSASNIASLLQNITEESNSLVMEAGTMDEELQGQVVTISRTITAFKEIIDEIHDMKPKISTVKESAVTIEENKNQILHKVDELSAVSEEISASAQEISASTEEMDASIQNVADSANTLHGMTDDMIGTVEQFKI